MRQLPRWGGQIEHSDIAVRDVGGANLRVLIRSRPFHADYCGAQFSRDGSRLVYGRENSPLARPARGHALFAARADGSGHRQITPWSLHAGDHPDWSPNCKLILFRSSGHGGKQSQVYVVRPDGSGLRALTPFRPGTTVLSYSFSPDGKWIVLSKSGPWRRARHLRHAGRRDGHSPGHPDGALGQRPRLGSRRRPVDNA